MSTFHQGSFVLGMIQTIPLEMKLSTFYAYLQTFCYIEAKQTLWIDIQVQYLCISYQLQTYLFKIKLNIFILVFVLGTRTAFS